MISRAEATEIGKLAARSKGLGLEVREALLPDELERPLSLYNVDIGNGWIVYVEDLEPYFLRSSTVLAIDRDSGRVLYHGSANDEG
jgi:hypothetical protein